MAQDACPKCKKQIDLGASVCPYCRSAFSDEEMQIRRTTNKDSTKNGLVGCIVIIGLIAVISTCSGAGGDKKTKAISPKDNKSAAISLYQGLIASTRECDAAAAKMAGPLEKGDVVGAYREASSTEDACLSTSSAIRKLEVPESFDGKRKGDAEKAIETCENAYLMKWSGAKSLKKALDGDTRPSVIAEIQDTAKAVQAGQMLCAGGLMSVAMSYGATETDLGLGDDPKP
jgi:hypothetical protein